MWRCAVDRLACVNVAALPLQILLRNRPDWSALPVAVVEEDRPQALVLWINGRARRAGICPGQRYATALALARDLRAGTVSHSQIAESVRALADRLRRYSPNIEPAARDDGVFWLDMQGLGSLYSSLQAWAESVRADLKIADMRAAVAVGFSRFGVYALAMSHRGTVVCGDTDEEHARVQRVSLGCLHLAPEAHERLHALGIATVGDFLHLPGDGIRARFGDDVDALYRLASGRRWTPLSPVPAEEPLERSVNFDAPESDAQRLLFVIKRLLDELVATLAREAQAIAGVSLQMRLDNRASLIEQIRPATPTLDVGQLLALIYLRLNALQLAAGIVTLRIVAETCPATPDQRRLFTEQSRRDMGAANQALARLRAECGEQSVVKAHICDAHLPSTQFAWQPLACMPARLAPRIAAARPLVRRICTRPITLTSGYGVRDPFIAFAMDGSENPEPEASVCGPYVLSGGWWGANGVHRDYYFLRTKDEIWWLYYDGRRKRFFLQGRVE